MAKRTNVQEISVCQSNNIRQTPQQKTESSLLYLENILPPSNQSGENNRVEEISNYKTLNLPGWKIIDEKESDEHSTPRVRQHSKRIPQMPNVFNLRQALANMSTPTAKTSSSRGSSIQADGLNENLDQMLKTRGYNIISRVLVRDSKNNSLHAQFIEALNDLGQKVFIDLDLPGIIEANQGDLIVVPDGIANTIPHSFKTGVFECAGLDVTGVALVCDNEICVLTWDEDGVGPHEINFRPESSSISTTENRAGDTNVDDYVVYPIVKLSDINENPKLTSETIDEVTRRLQNTIYENCKTGTKSTMAAIKKLESSLLEFIEVEHACSVELSKSIQALKQIHADYLKAAPTEANQIRYRKLLYNLRKRHEYAVELIHLCKKVNSKRDKILKYADYINEVSRHCLKGFKDFSRPLDEN